MPSFQSRLERNINRSTVASLGVFIIYIEIFFFFLNT